MTDLETARKTWIAERPLFEQFGKVLERRLQEGVRKLGIPADVTSRAKEIDSLVKKLILKPKHDYESLPDKVGVRIICKFRSDEERILRFVSQNFDHNQPDDKADERGQSEVGYLSVHLDNTRLKHDDQQALEFPPARFFAEVQLRTQAQHLWAEMSHDDVYKNDETARALASELKRRIHLMAGQIEVADREFDRINEQIGKDAAYSVLKALERNYFRLTARRPNPELSLIVIKLLLRRFGGIPIPEVIQQIENTFHKNESFLEQLYQDPDKADNPSAFFFQPEALMIFDRLLDDRVETLKIWNEEFPPKELDRVANAFGISLD